MGNKASKNKPSLQP